MGVVLAACMQPAIAAPIAIDFSVATWSNISNGANLELLDLDAIAGAETLRWGGDVVTAQKSGFAFDALPDARFEPGASTATLGWFTHFNQTIKRGTSIRGAILELELLLTLDDMAPASLPLEIRFRHRETDNDCNPAPVCANDLITVDLLEPASVVLGNYRFDIEAVGLLLNGDSAGSFSTAEEQANRAPMVARMSRTAIPEPATFTLLFGALTLILLRRLRPGLARAFQTEAGTL